MATAVGSETYFTSLPREYFVSQEIYERELESVFGTQWHYIAHLSEIPQAGDYLVEELAGESVVVVRGRDGAPRAFLNVCRHRGFQFCQQPSGKVNRFICPYHRWSYDLDDGHLLNAPDMPDGEFFDYGDWGLHKVQVDVWGGLIFVCLAEAPKAPVGPIIATTAPEIAKAQPERLKKAYEKRYRIDANWKVLLENFVECYHCKGTHPELCAAMDLEGMYGAILDRTDLGPGEYHGGQVPLKAGAKTQSIDGQLVSLPLGEFADAESVPDAWGAGFQISPWLSRIIFHVDHAMIFTLRPVDVRTVEWVSRWYVHEQAEEGRDYDFDRLTEVWLATNDQDLSLCSGTQQGIRSRRYVPGPLSVVREPAIHTVMATYLELMGGGSTGR